ncbi:TD and POZ domain-containing protein 4-like [Parasteatoda tepidariorum]|uniref:TD and POZ domain-containing protein 4-like n=1 Tax=Parasteatoda tepidariorum TaxID=114398 RepID=UPI0039BCECB2
MESVPGKVFTFNWKIETFHLSTLDKILVIESPTISIKCLADARWYLKLYPNGISFASRGFASCFLCKKESVDSNNDVILEILNSNGEILSSMERTPLIGSDAGKPKFIEIEQLRNSLKNCKTGILQIRCHVYDSSYNQPSVLCEALTQMETNKIEFSWKITFPKNRKWMRKINCPFQGDLPFDITLSSTDDTIWIKFEKLKDPLSKISVLKIRIINDTGVDVGSNNSSFSLKLPEFETSFLQNQLECKPGFTSTISFQLVCTIYNSEGNFSTEYVNYYYDESSDDLISNVLIHRFHLQDDLKDMFLYKKHCDVKLRGRNEIIPAHKCLLSARSPVFSVMFDQDMLETQTGIVDISDVESETLQSFLEFLYTDSITNTAFKNILELMLMAEKYQVSILKDRCSELLMSKLSLESVCDVISVADMVNEFNLKQSALYFIKANKKRILLSSEWSEWSLENMKLANEILTKLSLD